MDILVSNEFAKLLEILKDTTNDFNQRAAIFHYIMWYMEEDASMIMYASLGLQPDFVGEQPENFDEIMQDIQAMTQWLSVYYVAGGTEKNLKQTVQGFVGAKKKIKLKPPKSTVSPE